MIDQSQIGKVFSSHTFTVEAGRLACFARAIGETNPHYSDEATAIAAGFPALPVPPTFLACLEMSTPNPMGWFDEIGAELARILHGEQSFRYHKMAFAGDRLKFEKQLTDIYSKKGGALEFIVVKTTVTNQHGELVAELQATVIQRNG